jgi:hypothetical protein
VGVDTLPKATKYAALIFFLFFRLRQNYHLHNYPSIVHCDMAQSTGGHENEYFAEGALVLKIPIRPAICSATLHTLSYVSYTYHHPIPSIFRKLVYVFLISSYTGTKYPLSAS